MGKEFPLESVSVPKIKTEYRCIQTRIPVPESIKIIEGMRNLEPRSMSGQPPVIWEKGEGFCIHDPYGNKWIDFSSGVLVAASGYGHPDIVKSIINMANNGLYHAYAFPTNVRAKLVEKIVSIAPEPLNKVFLLTTGAEAVECCIKLARTYGLRNFGKDKNILLTYENAFHGRTMGAQMAGGNSSLKEWMGEMDPRFQQVPFPDGFRNKDISFKGFEIELEKRNIDPKNVCALMAETYQGGNASMWTPEYGKAMRKWCDENNILLILDEVQASFGRTGRWFAFEHLGIMPDLVATGKGISGGMPLSAVLGRSDVMDQFGPGEMTSTHSANPICSTAALANINVIENENLLENVNMLAPVLYEGAKDIQKSSNDFIGHIESVGLVAGLQFVEPGTIDPKPELAWNVVKSSVESGVMLFAPVGIMGSTVKINPPLNITKEALLEGLSVVKEVVAKLSF